jgi:hypothetical protein
MKQHLALRHIGERDDEFTIHIKKFVFVPPVRHPAHRRVSKSSTMPQ